MIGTALVNAMGYFSHRWAEREFARDDTEWERRGNVAGAKQTTTGH